MHRLLQFFEGQSGSLSSTRLLAVFSTVVILGTWCWASVRKLELQPLAPELVVVVLGSTGLVQVPKLVKNGADKPDEPAK